MKYSSSITFLAVFVAISAIVLVVSASQEAPCAPGTHRAGAACVLDQVCVKSDKEELDSCHGHGLCHEEHGWPQCQCFPGFASKGVLFVFHGQFQTLLNPIVESSANTEWAMQ